MKVLGPFVGDAGGAGKERADARKIAGRKLRQYCITHAGHRARKGSERALYEVGQQVELTAVGNPSASGEEPLGERRPGAQHAADENRARMPRSGRIRRQHARAGEGGDHCIDEVFVRGAIVARAGLHA